MYDLGPYPFSTSLAHGSLGSRAQTYLLPRRRPRRSVSSRRSTMEPHQRGARRRTRAPPSSGERSASAWSLPSVLVPIHLTALAHCSVAGVVDEDCSIDEAHGPSSSSSSSSIRWRRLQRQWQEQQWQPQHQPATATACALERTAAAAAAPTRSCAVTDEAHAQQQEQQQRRRGTWQWQQQTP